MKTPSSSIFMYHKSPQKQHKKADNENIEDDAADCFKVEAKKTNFH